MRLPARPGTVTFMLLIGGDRRQPEGDLLAAYRAAAGEPQLVIEGHRPAEVYRLQEPATGADGRPGRPGLAPGGEGSTITSRVSNPTFPVTGADFSACLARGRCPALLEVP